MKYIVTGTRRTEDEVECDAKDRYDAVSEFMAVYGRLPDAVECEDDVEFIAGACEGCSKVLFDGDDYGSDIDGSCYCCSDCADPMTVEERVAAYLDCDARREDPDVLLAAVRDELAKRKDGAA